MAKILQNHHVLAVHKLNEAVKFYTDVLGFKIVAEPEGWVFVSRDQCVLMLGECPDDLPPAKLGSHKYFAYFLVDDAHEYHASLKEKAGDSIGEISKKPWGMWEFTVRAPDGHTLMVGQNI